MGLEYLHGSQGVGEVFGVLGVFVLSIALMLSELMPRLKAMALGVSLLLLGGFTLEELFEAVDVGVLGLLLGMMVVVEFVKDVGLIQYMAARSVELSGGRPLLLMVSFSALVALASAFLDNVTTVLLVGPVVLATCDSAGFDPRPMTMAVILSANLGGMATLIGDPPNVMIGLRASLTFNQFLSNMTPLAVLTTFASIAFLAFLYREELKPQPLQAERALRFRASLRDLDWRLGARVLPVFVGVLLAMALHERLGLEPASLALTGASAVLLLSRKPVEEVLPRLDWATLVFLAGIMMLVGALDRVGLLSAVGGYLSSRQVLHGPWAVHAILWASALVSSLVGSVPFTASAIPVISRIASSGGLGRSAWWALAAGVGLGCNLTVFGGAANLVMVRMAEGVGLRVTSGDFLKVGGTSTLLSLLVSSVYFYLRY